MKQEAENMHRDGFVSTNYGSSSEQQVCRANLETKRAGIHRMQPNKKRGSNKAERSFQEMQ